MMQEDVQELLALTKENNRLLRKLHRSQIYGSILRIVWYAILIGIPVYLYFLLQPYLEGLFQTYQGIQDGLGTLDGVEVQNQVPSGLQELLEKLGIGGAE